MSKHTPGPWVNAPCAESVGRGEPHGPGHRCWTQPRDAAGRPVNLGLQANATLIAAAPDLLEALEEAASFLEMVGDDYEELCEYAMAASVRVNAAKSRAAIAKARGKPAPTS